MDAVIQRVDLCKVLMVDVHGTTEHEHCDLAGCGTSCCCPAEGRRTVLGNLNANSCTLFF